MIRQNETKKKIKNLDSRTRRYLRKLEAKKHNEEYVPYSLSPKEYVWDTNCKKCLGRGHIGETLKTSADKDGKLVLCSCCMTKKEYTDAQRKKQS